MTWARLDDGFHSHPKVIDLSFAARGLFATFLSYAAHFETDGLLTAKVVAKTAHGREGRRALRELTDAGMLETAVDGHPDDLLIHDYLDCNPSRAELEAERERNRQKSAQRRVRGRQSQLPWEDPVARTPGSTPGGTTGRDGEEETPTSRTAVDARAPEGDAAVVEEVLAILRQLDRPGWVVDDVNTRIGVENALCAHPNRDPIAAARLTVTAASDASWRTTSPQRAFAIILGKQPERDPRTAPREPHVAGQQRQKTCPYGECEGDGVVIDEENDRTWPCRCRGDRSQPPWDFERLA